MKSKYPPFRLPATKVIDPPINAALFEERIEKSPRWI